jgi:hypothetical protein
MTPFLRLQRIPRYGGKIPIALLSLTQVCAQVRAEFRPWRLRGVTVALCDLQVYMYIFVAQYKINSVLAFEKFQNTVGSIRIHVSTCQDVNIVPLLRLKAHQPACAIEFTAASEDSQCALACNLLINNRNEDWVDWVVNGVLEQARLGVKQVSWTAQYRGWPVRLCLVLRRADAGLWIEPGRCYVASVPIEHTVKRGLDIPGLRVQLEVKTRGLL